MRFETKAIHSGKVDEKTGATNVPIYQSAAFAYETAQELEDVFNGRKFGHYYSRASNPTVSALETCVSQLEDGQGAVAFASGMAAIYATVLALAKSGDSIVASTSLFGSTFYLFKGVVEDAGISVRFVPATDTAQFEASIDDATRLIFIESIGNPKLDVADIDALSKLARAHRIPLVVDSTFTTPYLFEAKKWADVVIHATTKYLCGGGSAVGGMVVDLGNLDWTQNQSPTLRPLLQKFGKLAFLGKLGKVRSNTGGVQTPQNAFLTLKGIETLALRMDRHCQNALALAQFFSAHPKVREVHYPGLESDPAHLFAKKYLRNGFGGMLTICLGGQENAYAFIDGLKLAKNLVNLGDSKTLVVAPRRTIYRDFTDEQALAAGVSDDLVRISVGLEHADDIVTDFEQALHGVN